MKLQKVLFLFVLVFQVGVIANPTEKKEDNITKNIKEIKERISKIEKHLEKDRNDNLSFTPAKFRENNETSYRLIINTFIAYEAFGANQEDLKDHANFGMSSYLEYPYAHFYGNIYLKEYQINDTNDTINSVKMDVGMFLPFISGLYWKTTNKSFRNVETKNNFSNSKTDSIYKNQPKFGLLIEGTAIKLSSDMKAKRAINMGLRYALSPYRYFDVVYEKIEGLHNKVKIRTEYQLNTSIIFGANYSFEPTSKEVTAENQDTVKVYVKLPISIETIQTMINRSI